MLENTRKGNVIRLHLVFAASSSDRTNNLTISDMIFDPSNGHPSAGGDQLMSLRVHRRRRFAEDATEPTCSSSDLQKSHDPAHSFPQLRLEFEAYKVLNVSESCSDDAVKLSDVSEL